MGKDAFQSVRENIENIVKKEGHAVIGTASKSEDDSRLFSYTVGLSDRGSSDLMMMGFDTELMNRLLNDIALKMEDGDVIEKQRRMSGIIKDFDVLIKPIFVDEAAHIARLLNKRESPVRLAQVVLPDKFGTFPGEGRCNPEIAKMQDHRYLLV